MIDAIPRADTSSLFTDEEKAVLAVSTELTKTAGLSQRAFNRARGFFNERALVELVVNTSIANLNNRLTDAFSAEAESDE